MRVTVDRANLDDAVLDDGDLPLLRIAKGSGQVLLRVDHAALTTNNITYALTGELPPLFYWRHFPESADSDARGIVPVWGFATVVLSGCSHVHVGSRYYGFYPMSTFAVVIPERKPETLGSFVDVTPHRASLPAAYLRYFNVDHDKMYVSPKLERFDAALRGLFFTGWMLRDTLSAKKINGASTLFVTSASSKTSLGLAWELKVNPIPGVSVVGLTSKGNTAFCLSSGCYERVVDYEHLAQEKVKGKVMYVDMAGSKKVLEDIHAHFDVVPGLTVGLSHGTRLTIRHLVPVPEFYFVGAWMEHLARSSPQRNWAQEMAASYVEYLTHMSTIMKLQTADTADQVLVMYKNVLDGKIPPSEVCSFSLTTQASAKL